MPDGEEGATDVSQIGAKPIVAIVGRPNVGKSTLFNRIVGHRKAIVEDSPGVTRDRNYAPVAHEGKAFIVVDTGGFDPDAREGMLQLMREQVSTAIAEADALIMVTDVREGLTPSDQAVWELLREGGKRVYCVANKVDLPVHEAMAAEFYRLGAAAVFSISAELGSGVSELLDTVLADLDAPDAEPVSDESGPIRIAVIGRPNVGKSTFLNTLLGSERFLTSNVPGTTRDAIDMPVTIDGRDYVLVDTAGMRRRKSVERGIELMSVSRTITALERCHVVILIMDASEGITDQDKKLAALAAERGRGIILVMNKWDLVKEGPKAGDIFRQHLEEELAFVSFAPHLFTSALNHRRVKDVMPLVDRVHANLFKRIPTHELNVFYEEFVRQHPPSTSGTRSVRIRYLTQVEVNPPTMLLFKSGKADVPPQYLRFLQRHIRERYGFDGVPLRLIPK